MKKFFRDYSYSMVRMFIDQIAISIFGASLAFATRSAHLGSDSFDTFTLVVSIFSACFYLFLIYNLSWGIGAKDRIAVDVKKKPYRPYLGIVLSLFANIPNLILVTLNAIATFTGAKALEGVVELISLCLNGMYWGTLSVVKINYMGHSEVLVSFWVSFLVAVLPAVLTSGIAYFLGHKNFKFFGFITDKKPKNPIDRPNMK